MMDFQKRRIRLQTPATYPWAAAPKMDGGDRGLGSCLGFRPLALPKPKDNLGLLLGLAPPLKKDQARLAQAQDKSEG